jgi:hypothetical protein
MANTLVSKLELVRLKILAILNPKGFQFGMSVLFGGESVFAPTPNGCSPPFVAIVTSGPERPFKHRSSAALQPVKAAIRASCSNLLAEKTDIRSFCAKNAANCSRVSSLRNATEPSLRASCSWKTHFARSTPIIVTSDLRAPSVCDGFNTHHNCTL